MSNETLDALRKRYSVLIDPAPPEEECTDRHWHTIITQYEKKVVADDGSIETKTTEKEEAGIYRDGHWSLGMDKKNRPINGKVIVWDREVRVENRSGDPISKEGATRLAEAILEAWRQDYVHAWKAYRMEPERESRLRHLKDVEREFPDWIVPAELKDAVLTAIRCSN